VPLVPHRSEHGAEVDADSESDEVREHDHHDAYAAIVVVIRDEIRGEEEVGEHTQTRHAEGSCQPAGNHRSQSDSALYKSKDGAGIEHKRDEEGDDEHRDLVIDSSDLSHDKLLRGVVDDERDHPPEADHVLHHRATGRGQPVDPLVPALQSAGDANSTKHQEGDPQDVQTDNGVMARGDQLVQVFGCMSVQAHAARKRLADVMPGSSGNDEENRDQAQDGKGGELRRARHEFNGVESAPIGAWCTRPDPIESS